MTRNFTQYFQYAGKTFIRALLLSTTFLLLACGTSGDGGGSGGGGSSRIKSTKIPFLFNGEDSGYKILVFLANYSQQVSPSFGADGDAEISEDGDTLTVRFHPTNKYSDTGGHGAANQYFLYVGLFAPPLSIDADGKVIKGGMPERKGIKGQNVHFTGEFRFDRGDVSVRKHFALSPTLMYHRFGPGGNEYKQIAFNNYGGLEGYTSDTLNIPFRHTFLREFG